MHRSAVAALTVAFAFAAAFASSASAQDAGEPVDLGPRWAKGQSATYRLTQTQTMDQSMELVGAPPDVQAPPPSRSTLELDALITWTVTESDAAGGGTATLVFDAITMKLAGDGKSITVTADKAPEGSEGVRDWIAAMSGKTITYTVDPTGHITRTDGWKAIKTALGDAGDDMDEAYFKEIAEDLALLTGGAAKRSPGDSWKEAHDSDHRMGTIHYDTTYELQSASPVAGVPVALINRNAKMKFTPDLSELPPDAPKPDVKVTDSAQTGQLMFDLTRHELVGANSDQVLDITTTASRGALTVRLLYREVTNTQVLRTSEK